MKKIPLAFSIFILCCYAQLAVAEPNLSQTATQQADTRLTELHHYQAAKLVSEGKILTLRETLSVLDHSCENNKLMDAKLFQQFDRWIYQLKLKGKGGELLQLDVDASSGKLLSSSLPCSTGR